MFDGFQLVHRPERTTGLAQHRRGAGQLHFQILDQFASADGTRVVTRFHSRQRHAGTYFGIPATHRVVLFDETHVARVRDGLIVENIVSATNLEFEMLMAPVLAPWILR